MGITRAQYIQGDNNQAIVLNGQVQGITPDNVTVTISPSGVLSATGAAFLRQIDDISGLFNGTAQNFPITAGGVPFDPVSADNILISLGGVLQLPGPAFSIGGPFITFGAPPPAGTTFAGYVIANGPGGGSGGGPGTVTSVGTGIGLSGGPILTTGTINLDPATTVSLGGVIPDGTTISVNGAGVISTVIPPAVTQVDTGVGLSGGPITSTGTIDLDVATTASLGGVIPDGTTITVDGAGVISAVPTPTTTATIVNLGTIEPLNGTNTVFTLAYFGTTTPYPLSSTTNLTVFLGGVPQLPGLSYTVSGNQITFSPAPPAGTDFIAITIANV